MTEVLNFAIYLNVTIAMVTKMADKIDINREIAIFDQI